MTATEQSTKQKIVTAALDLFSLNGFTTVSVRDIGRAVGIKESSIYYHFSNKEHILQTILHEAEQQTEARKASFVDALQAGAKVERESFAYAGIVYVEHYLLEERMYKLIRMLTIEKQRNELAAALFHKLMFTWPLQHQEQVFRYMMDKGLIRQDDAKALAAEYQALILFVFQRYFAGSGVVTEASKAAARQELTELLDRFYIRYA